VESYSSRRLTGTLVAGALGVVAAFGVAKASAGPPEQSGVFALLGGTPKITSTFWAEHGSGLSAVLKIRQFRIGSNTPIVDYDVDMQKLIHLIVVRDDFATFVHLHPNFDRASGTFSQPFTKVPNHRYYVYVDTTPRGIGQQVFRFTIESDGPVATLHPALSVVLPSVVVGPYRVTLNQMELAANQKQTLALTVFQGRRLAADLRTYLGAAAHAVFINTTTLVYVHVHPTVQGTPTMNMPGSMESMSRAAGPRMQMVLPPLPAGTYKLWVQFRGREGEVFTAPFTVQTR
jgi:hypothetical protein